MTVDKNGVFKCLCPPKFGGPLCEGKPLLLFFFLIRTVVDNAKLYFYTSFVLHFKQLDAVGTLCYLL